MSLINFSGIASGIDSNSLIQATSDAARAVRVTPNQNKISQLEDTNSALNELKTKLKELQALLYDNFSDIAGGALIKQASTSDETIVTATASNSASNGSYQVTVSQLAKNATYSFASSAGTYSSATSLVSGSIAGTGTVTVKLGRTTSPDETVAISVTNTTTLTDFVNSFNNASSYGEASVINVGTSASPDYRVIITGNNVGIEDGQIDVTVSSEITTANAFNSNTESDAVDATFQVAGISGNITRSSNSVNDLIPGVTFFLQSTGGPVNVNISDDLEQSTAKMQEWIDAYNDIVNFVRDNNLITRDEEGNKVQTIFSPLATTRVDDNAITAIRNDLIASKSTNDVSSTLKIKIFADLGVTTNRDGTLAFNSTTFKSALATESSSVDTIMNTFANAVSKTGNTIDQYVAFNKLIDLTITGNGDLIKNLNQRIAQAEAAILKQEESMRARFARLESTIGRLQGQQGALTSALAGLSRN